jgi:predicted DsbA family dithiol-disulfide isomerase
VGLDMKKFEDSLETQRAKPLIDADAAEAKTLGVTGTPAFFVNGRFLSGAKPFDEFAQTINAELTKKNVPVPPMPSPSAAGAKAGG